MLVESIHKQKDDQSISNMKHTEMKKMKIVMECLRRKLVFNSFLLSTPVNIPKKDDRQNCICKIHPTY